MNAFSFLVFIVCHNEETGSEYDPEGFLCMSVCVLVCVCVRARG